MRAYSYLVCLCVESVLLVPGLSSAAVGDSRACSELNRRVSKSLFRKGQMSVLGVSDERGNEVDASVRSDGEPGTWQDSVREISRQIALGSSGSVAGFCWNFQQDNVDTLRVYVRECDLVNARAFNKSLDAAIDRHRVDIVNITLLQHSDPIVTTLVERANYVFQKRYLDEKVRLVNGDEESMRTFLGEGGYDYLKTEAFQRFGFDANTAHVYLCGDVTQRRLLHNLIDAAISGGGWAACPNRTSLVEMVDDVAANTETVVSGFGKGTEEYLRYVMRLCRATGDAKFMMRKGVERAYELRNGAAITDSKVLGSVKDFLKTVKCHGTSATRQHD